MSPSEVCEICRSTHVQHPIRICDECMMTHVRQGDRGALDELYLRHRLEMIRFASYILNNIDLCEEVVQETFLQVWRNRMQWDGRQFRAWAYTIVRNTALTLTRRRHDVPLDTTNEEIGTLADQADDSALELAEVVAARETAECLDRCLGQLNWNLKVVVILRNCMDWGYRDIADTLGIALATAHDRHQRAIELLRDCMSRCERQ